MRSGQTLFVNDVLFAFDIRRNLVFVLVLLKFDFQLRFHGQDVDLFLGQDYYGCGYFLNGFIVLDVEHDESNVYFFYFTQVVNYKNNEEVWHAKLGLIGQSRMNRLAKECLLGSLKKVELSTCEHCLVGKTKKKTIWKRNQSYNSIAINLFKHMWSNECQR